MLFNSQLLKCPVAELVRSVACKDWLYFMIIQNCLVCFLKAAEMQTNCTSEPIPHDITASTSRYFTVLGRARPANLRAAIIVAMRGRSEVRGSDLRPAVALQNLPRSTALSRFAHLRRRERNTRGERLAISRTYRFICCPQPGGQAGRQLQSNTSRLHAVLF